MGTKTIKIIVGLGNNFATKSRHSIGMQVCNVLAEDFSCSWEYNRKYKAFVTSIHSNLQEFVLMKSRWPMNLNGRSVSKIVLERNVEVGNITIIHDDVERELGKLSWKLRGSAGGHNGVKSVISSLQSDRFRRLRVGIGRPDGGGDLVSYVLNDFAKEEEKEVELTIQKAVELIINDLLPGKIEQKT